MLNQPEVREDHKNIVEQGFTLVELLIVIVILGILAGIVVFAVGNLTQDAGKSACQTEGATFESAFQAYKAHNSGKVPAGTTQQDILDTLQKPDGVADPGGPYLNHAPANFAEPATAGKWTFSVTTGVADTGSCKP